MCLLGSNELSLVWFVKKKEKKKEKTKLEPGDLTNAAPKSPFRKYRMLNLFCLLAITDIWRTEAHFQN